jgi:hypothetical protein
MAKYVIVENSYEYNDEYYEQPESDGYTITSKLYSEEQLDEARAEVTRLNKERAQDEWFCDYDNEPIQPFKIVKIEE